MMAEQDLPTTAGFYVWVSKDSQRILGFDHRSVEYAHQDAVDKHEDTRGYPATLVISGFPPGANPMIAMVKALHEAFPPSRVEAADEQIEAGVPEEEPTKLKKVK